LQFFAVSMHDPMTFADTPPVLLTAAMLARLLTMCRATSGDPVTVLRRESSILIIDIHY